MINKKKPIVHRTSKGRVIDMERLRAVNSTVRAVGNANLNARGDKLDSSGNIIKKREDMVNEYYSKQQSGIQYVSLSGLEANPVNKKEAIKKQVINELETTKFATPEELQEKRKKRNTSTKLLDDEE